ncbi:hypothetical protein JCM11251_006996 [Rhodosporidiobolus azoricus]
MSDDNSRRMDWNSMMMMQDPDENKGIADRSQLDREESTKYNGLSELGKTPAMFDYDEPGDSQPEHHLQTVWHNAMMHVDVQHSATETYDSMPHWQWIDDE